MGLRQLSGKHVLSPLLLSEVEEILVQMSKALIGLKQKLLERESKKFVRFYKRMDELLANGLAILPWPSHSADFNPTEQLQLLRTKLKTKTHKWAATEDGCSKSVTEHLEDSSIW